MEYHVDEQKYKIEITGSKREIKKFARCLVEVVNKHRVSDFNQYVKKNNSFIFDIDQLHRIYLENSSLTYIQSGGSDVHFSIIKQSYQKAREKFEKH